MESWELFLKTIMKKIEIKNTKPNLKPNALILHDDEILTETCDVYKLDLTEDQKAKHFLKYLRNRELYPPTSIEGLQKTSYWGEVKNSDFYVFRLKEEFRKMLKIKKSLNNNEYWFFFNEEELTLLWDDDSSISCEIKSIPDPSDLFDLISEYIDYRTDYSYSENKLICDNGITQVRLIHNIDQIFE